MYQVLCQLFGVQAFLNPVGEREWEAVSCGKCYTTDVARGSREKVALKKSL